MSNKPRLQFHVSGTAGAAGRFRVVRLSRYSPAGRVACPDIAAPEESLRAYPYGPVRVLGADARASGSWDSRLPPDVLRQRLRAMLLTRVFDDRLFRSHRQGQTSFYMKSTGEKAISVAQSFAP